MYCSKISSSLYSAQSLFPNPPQSVLELVDVVIDDGFRLCRAVVSHNAYQSEISLLVSIDLSYQRDILTGSSL